MSWAHLLASLLTLALPAATGARPRWSDRVAGLAARVRGGAPLVVQVLVPLCDNAQIACGDHGLGNPLSLRTNLYWGALFGAVRFFERPGGDYRLLSRSKQVAGVLERRVYRRLVPAAAWGLPANRRVEQIVVLDAVHGAHVDEAVRRFWRLASRGGTVRLQDGGRPRVLRVSAVGYAGHNRLMDGVKLLPGPESIHRSRRAIPSFALACFSDAYFAAPLGAAGSAALITTDGFMAPEGYVVEATVRGLGDNVDDVELRRRVVAAYAKWQRLSLGQAARLFTDRSAARPAR